MYTVQYGPARRQKISHVTAELLWGSLNISTSSSRSIVVNHILPKSMKMAEILKMSTAACAAWQLIQAWFVTYISTQLITQTQQILRFFIKHSRYQCTSTISWFYFQFILFSVQNLSHYILPDKVSDTGIFDSVLNIALSTTTAASDRLIGGM